MTYWQDKVVVVTGGAAGLGKQLSTHFARSGAHVVLADRDQDALERTTAELAEHAGPVEGMPTDVTDQGSVDRLFTEVDKRFHHLDVLVNCAGRSGRGCVLDTSPETFQAFLDLNFLGTVRCTRAAAPRLLASKGHLVNIGSLAAKVASAYLSAYPVSKFAVAAYSHQLRLELGPQGLHVLLVCPGPIARGDAGRRYEDQAENLPASARKAGGGARLKGIDMDVLANRVLRACQRRQPELIIPAKVRLLVAILQLWPSLGDWIIRRNTET
ncbi:MAG: SDR family NAD(P)-dependent oxidoreductase [Planctomycetota bacterium]